MHTAYIVSSNKPPSNSSKHNQSSASSNNSKRLTTPSPGSLRNGIVIMMSHDHIVIFLVPDSPDLVSHARSLRGTVYEPSSPTHHKNNELSGDVILEDTGGEKITCKDIM